MPAVMVIGAGPGIGRAVARRVTGGMPEPKWEYTSLSLGKAGLRTLVTMLCDRYAPAGIHVADVIVDGPVAAGTDFDPDLIAEHYRRLHAQPRDGWANRVVHTGRSPDDAARG
ncbi:short-chain dehydrogenase [Nocardia higoensis]|uniref:short-chain dehydrogenase n=1 Tax=Nocardia higoensis TaxID=228599 RepID=UPI00030AE8A4|nr:short-chain dehydrogenase [Nocardia higoensis]